MLVEMYSQDVKNKDSLKVYLIDDELETLNAYERFCTRSGFEAECFVQPEAFLKRYASIDRSQTHVVISDMSMPKMLGLELMEKLSEINPDVIVLFLTGNRDVSSAVEAMKKGAFDYLVKSPNFDEFSVRLKRAFGAHEAKLDSKILESQAFQLNSFFGIQGQSLAVKNLFSKLRKVIDAQSPVLLIGPSGSGKFKVAESLHNRGAKSGGEFIVHSFASSPENSFVKEGRDLFVRASGGTLFLDSIDKMMEAEQIVVLQLIKSFSETQIRIISSSGVNLGKLGQPENFNQELFYLLSVFPIDIPSLKERSEDIPMLALDFLRAAARAWGRPCRKFSKAAQKLLVNHSWPGNLKELERQKTFNLHQLIYKISFLGLMICIDYQP